MDMAAQSKYIIHDDSEKGVGENAMGKLSFQLLTYHNVRLKVLMCVHVSLTDFGPKCGPDWSRDF